MDARRIDRVRRSLGFALAAWVGVGFLAAERRAAGNDAVSRTPRPAARPAEAPRTPASPSRRDRRVPDEMPPAVLRATEADFAALVLDAESPVLVDFYAAWCGPCRAMAPTLEDFAQETPRVRVVKLDVDAAPRLAARYGIKSLPSLLLFRDGKVVAKQTGVTGKKRLQSMLDLYADAPLR